jgi:hypothetical protein
MELHKSNPSELYTLAICSLNNTWKKVAGVSFKAALNKD